MTPGHAEWGIVRILAARPGKLAPAGAGFLVSDHYALTCAHVVNESLNRDPYTSDKPDAPVFLDLPAGAGPEPASGVDSEANTRAPLVAHVIAWCPAREQPRQGQPDDIAVLKLETPCDAENALPIVRSNSAVSAGYRGHAYGFPERGDDGIWAEGKLSGHQHFGWRQIADVEGPNIAAGFSGCPFLDAAQERVIGMVVARHNRFPVSYLIPIETLLQAWDKLAGIARQVDLPEPTLSTTPAGASARSDQQQNVSVNVNVSLEGAPQPNLTPAAPAPTPPDATTVDTPAAAAEPRTLTLRVDFIEGMLCVTALRPKAGATHRTLLADLQQAIDNRDHDALFRALFESPFQLANLLSAVNGSTPTDDPTAKPVRLRLHCSSTEAASLPWHCLSHDGRRLGEAGWIVEVLAEADGAPLTIALDNPLVVAPSDPTLPFNARSHATQVAAYIRRLLADRHALVPWVRSCRELDTALDNEPDLLYLFAQVDRKGALILGKDAEHCEAYSLDRLMERVKGFRSKPLVWLHLIAADEIAAKLAAQLHRLRPLTHLLLIQLTTQGKLIASLNGTLEWMDAMADGKEEPAAVLSRLGPPRGTHLWLGGRSLALSPCGDTDAALFDYIRASLIRLLLGRKTEKRQLRSGIDEVPAGYVTLYGVCGDEQACVHDLPEQTRHYIQWLDRHTIVETRPLPFTMRASPGLRDEIAVQLSKDLNITNLMSAKEALKRIPVVEPDREDTLVIALSWLLEPADGFTPDLLPAWLAAWKHGLLDILEKDEIPANFRLLVSACIQWPDDWPERHGSDPLALQQEIDRVLEQGNPRNYVHRIEMERPLSLLRAADLHELFREQRLKDRLHVKDLSVEALVDYILAQTRGGRFQATVDLIYTECKHRYAGFRDSLKGPDA